MRYRITKYDPAYRNCLGTYQHDEWTSCSDIGMVFCGKCLQLEEYLAVEASYLCSICKINEIFNCGFFVVKELEKPYTDEEIILKLTRIGLPMTEDDLHVFHIVSSGFCIVEKELLSLAKMILRELLWGSVMSADGKIMIEFGYDYYMYITCPMLTKLQIKSIEALGVFVEINS